MPPNYEYVGSEAALDMRRRATGVRLALMAVIALMLQFISQWPVAGLWWVIYAGLQLAILTAQRRAPNRPILLRALLFTSYALAGAPTWHMWTSNGELGIAAATMYLCGIMMQLVVSTLAARSLFWICAAPLIAYLILVPIFAFGQDHLTSGLAIAGCAVLLVSYLGVVWRGQQQAFVAMELSRRQAEEASRAKTEFVSTMSHEIRTPMNAVLGAAHLLGRTDMTQEQKGYVAMLIDGGSMLMQLLNDVLDMSKIEAGKLSIDRVNVDAHGFVRRCAAFWAPRAADAGLELVTVIAPGAPCYVLMDGTRVGQIFFNLLSNALKFTAQGSVTLTLDGLIKDDGTCELLLSVSDTGMGMSDETQGRLFTAFEQADGSISRRFGGTGLGLSISQKLAVMMDGRISVQSAPEGGSTFTLHLPVVQGQAPAEPAQASGGDDGASATQQLRILVAEDNPSNQRVIDLFLRPIGADVVMVANGQAAVEAADLSGFDVILMDMQMPVMDGLEATRVIRAGGGPNGHTPILALTANIMDAHRQACADAGMTGHIAKPIDARLMITSVLQAALGAAAVAPEMEDSEAA